MSRLTKKQKAALAELRLRLTEFTFAGGFSTEELERMLAKPNRGGGTDDSAEIKECLRLWLAAWVLPLITQAEGGERHE